MNRRGTPTCATLFNALCSNKLLFIIQTLMLGLSVICIKIFLLLWQITMHKLIYKCTKAFLIGYCQNLALSVMFSIQLCLCLLTNTSILTKEHHIHFFLDPSRRWLSFYYRGSEVLFSANYLFKNLFRFGHSTGKY